MQVEVGTMLAEVLLIKSSQRAILTAYSVELNGFTSNLGKCEAFCTLRDATNGKAMKKRADEIRKGSIFTKII